MVLCLPGDDKQACAGHQPAGRLQAACGAVVQRESRWGREHALVVAAPGAALWLGHGHQLPSEQLLFPGSLGLEVRLGVSHGSRDPA